MDLSHFQDLFFSSFHRSVPQLPLLSYDCLSTALPAIPARCGLALVVVLGGAMLDRVSLGDASLSSSPGLFFTRLFA